MTALVTRNNSGYSGSLNCEASQDTDVQLIGLAHSLMNFQPEPLRNQSQFLLPQMERLSVIYKKCFAHFGYLGGSFQKPRLSQIYSTYKCPCSLNTRYRSFEHFHGSGPHFALSSKSFQKKGHTACRIYSAFCLGPFCQKSAHCAMQP